MDRVPGRAKARIVNARFSAMTRLKEGPPPESVETRLTVKTAPVADPQRYDALREALGTEVSHG